MLGMGHALGQKWVYDQHYGVPLATRFYQNRPPTILDVPPNMQWAALEIPDPETPVGARGIGEPPVAAGCCAILNAISAAVGDEIFRRAPVNADTILTSLEAGRPVRRRPHGSHLDEVDRDWGLGSGGCPEPRAPSPQPLKETCNGRNS